MELALGTLLIRTANAILWAAVVLRILRRDRPVSGLARKMICLVIGIGMWLLVIGGLTPFGLPGEAAKTAYTVYTAFSAIIAVSLLTVGD